MSDNPQRLTRFDADGARIPQVPCYGTTLNGTALSRNGRREMANAVRAGVVNGDTGRMHGPFRVPGDTNDRDCYGSHYPRLGYSNVADQPTFTPTDRQRRRIAGARAYLAQRLTVAYSGELDTGREHGPRCGPDCTWCKRRFGAHA